MKTLIEAVVDLTGAIREGTNQRWMNLATKDDLQNMEERLRAVIRAEKDLSPEDALIIDRIKRQMEQRLKKLERLAALTPNQK